VTLPEKIEHYRWWLTTLGDDERAAMGFAEEFIGHLIAAYESALTALEASDSDRETLKQRLDGVYGALADAANIVVSTDNPGESVRMLLAERDQLSARVAELEALCQTIGKQSTEYATKVGYAEGRAMGLEYRVEELEAELAALRPHLATVLEHAERCRLGPQEIAAFKAALAD
jgi:chromosome segregation ATPase